MRTDPICQRCTRLAPCAACSGGPPRRDSLAGASCRTSGTLQHRYPVVARRVRCAGAVHGTSWELEEVRGNAVKTMLTLAAISTVASLQVFGKDRLIFWRESAAGGS